MLAQGSQGNILVQPSYSRPAVPPSSVQSSASVITRFTILIKSHLEDQLHWILESIGFNDRKIPSFIRIIRDKALPRMTRTISRPT